MQVITLAGSSNSGYVDGAGSAARFTGPYAITIDNTGTMYVAEAGNHRIRKVTNNGVVTSIAGPAPGVTPMIGTTDGIGTAARFTSPFGLALQSGFLYVADYGSHRLRKINLSTNEVTTIAGSSSGYLDGIGTAAKLQQPNGLSIISGQLYIADRSNNRIRKMDLTTNEVSTVAGSSYGYLNATGTNARFTMPSGMVSDGAGNLYVADLGNNRIRKIELTSGLVTTIAGDGNATFRDGVGENASFFYPVGLAWGGAGTLYVADVANNRIRKIEVNTGKVTTLAGSGAGFADGTGSAAAFFSPTGLVVDADQNIFVADQVNHRIRKMSKYAIKPAPPVS